MKNIILAAQIILKRSKAVKEHRVETAPYSGVYHETPNKDVNLWLKSAGLAK